jgi:hypothetical protein
MENLPSVNSVEEILNEDADLRASLARFQKPAPRQLRGSDTAASAPTRGPADLANPVARRCDPDNHRRLAEIAWWETQLPSTFDSAPLIVQSCQVIEQELVRIVAVPSRRLGATLLRALEGSAKPQQIEIVAKWLEDRVPTTMGTVEVILFALRQGKDQGLPEVEGFLGATFRPGYANLLATNGPGRALARIRQGYRNPAAHGTSEIPGSNYSEYCGLAVACESFGYWGRARSLPDPPPDRGLLHHHLNYLPGELATATAVPTLASLATPPGSKLSVRAGVEPASPTRFRSIGIAPRREKSGFGVGDTVRFVVSVDEPCWVALLALSADGGASVLLPNGFRPYGRQPRGTLYVPDRARPECEFPLEGPSGTQSVCAVATSEPLPATLLSPKKKALLRNLKAAETAELKAAIEAMPAEGRAIGWCEFEVSA